MRNKVLIAKKIMISPVLIGGFVETIRRMSLSDFRPKSVPIIIKS